jgi:hypothetical protein
MSYFTLTRTLDETRLLTDAYVVFRSIETTLTDGSKVYDVVARAVIGGDVTDIAFCQSEMEALELAARLNSALLCDRTQSGYAAALADGIPG